MRAGAASGHILVVERDMIVGLSLAEDLLDRGYRVSGPFISASDVMTLLDTDPPDAAIIDLALRDGTGIATARALKGGAIPFVLFTSDDRREHESGEFRDVPWIEKPSPIGRILRALGEPDTEAPMRETWMSAPAA